MLTSDRTTLVNAIIMQSSTIALAILGRVIASTLFISHYPINWLIYFYCGQALTTSMVIFSTISFFSNKSYLIYIQFIFILLVIAISNLINNPWEWSILIGSLALLTIGDMFGSINWHCVNKAFSLQNLKKSYANILLISTLFACIINFILAKFFHHERISVLFYFLIFFMIVASIGNILLRSISKPIRKKIKSPKIFAYHLFQQLFIYGFLITFVYAMADYILKYSLAKSFNETQIASFQLYYFSILGFICLLVIMLSKKILEYLSLRLLLSMLPLYFLVTSLGIIFSYNLWTATLFAMGYGILFYSCTLMGRELIFNVLPNAIADKGRTFLNGLATPLGILTAILLIWSLNLKGDFVILGVISMTVMVLLLIYLRQVSKHYFETLKDAIAAKRFDISADQSLLTDKFYTLHIINMLKNAVDAYTIVFCFDLLKEISLKAAPQEVMKMIDSENHEIRKAAMELTLAFNDKTQKAIVYNHLDFEINPDIIKMILYSLAQSDNDVSPDLIDKFFKYEDIKVKIAAICLALRKGNNEQINFAREELTKLSNSTDHHLREEIACSISFLPQELLLDGPAKMLEDENPNVNISAIIACRDQKPQTLLPGLINSLSKTKIAGYAINTLIQYDLIALPSLINAISTSHIITSMRIIKIIAKIKDLSAEENLIRIIQCNNSFLLCVLAKESAQRACILKITEQYKKIAKNQIQSECLIIENLFFRQHLTLFEKIKNEIINEIQLAKQRLLHWIVVISPDPISIMEIVPFINKDSLLDADKKYIYYALEMISQMKLVDKKVINILSDNISQATDSFYQKLPNSWLDKVEQITQRDFNNTSKLRSNEMILLEKVFSLRKTMLFKNLSGEVLYTIAQAIEVLEINKDEVIFNQGEVGEALYIVHSGTIEIKRNNQVISKLCDGELFGELALIDNKPRTSSAIAESDCTLLYLDKQTFEDIAYSFPEILWEISNQILKYLRAADVKIG